MYMHCLGILVEKGRRLTKDEDCVNSGRTFSPNPEFYGGPLAFKTLNQENSYEYYSHVSLGIALDLSDLSCFL